MSEQTTMMERCARAIAAGLGYEWDTLYEGKREWVADRGSRHDINTPYKPDFTDAARTVIEALIEPTPEMIEILMDPESPFIGRRTMDKRQGEVVQLMNDDWRTTIPLDDQIRHVGYFEGERVAVAEAKRLSVVWRYQAMLRTILSQPTKDRV